MNILHKTLIGISLSALVAVSANANDHNKVKRHTRLQKNQGKKPARETVLEIAREAYIYGLPIVFTDLTRQASALPDNTFVHSHKFPDPTSKLVVAPNNDTNYSSAFLDLNNEPMVLSIPDTRDRYYVLPLMDAWTNVFASFGKRTTGTHAQTYIITGPHWKGTIPAGLTEVKAPTDLVWIIGRIQVNSPEDQAGFVSGIQDQFKLSPLSGWEKEGEAKPNFAVTEYSTAFPEIKAVQHHELTVVQAVKRIQIESYFNYLNELLIKNPGAAGDVNLLKRLATIGIKPGGKFSLTSFDAETQDALKNLPEQVFQSFDSNTPETFDGTKRSTAPLGNYKTDYLKRAVVAYKGLGALDPQDAVYIGFTEDDSKNVLTGSDPYVIHFKKGQLPPARAFWSLTMYDKDRYLVENPIRRYAIGDRNKLQFNEDGSLDIYVQHENPGKEKESNWLPAPAANFNVILRIYWPTEAYLKDNNNWSKPTLKRQN